MLDSIQRLRDNVSKVLLGNPAAIDRVVICLLARGHLLIEDVPGVGKTVLATAVARSIDCSFSRIQMTPDLLPSDILGVSILDRERGEFRLQRGPIFANIVLADEINRTPPRTQAALLEAMSEGAVSVDGKTLPIDPPFMVIATQNPLDFEGTYPLPENQLDRFLMRISLGYPSAEEEAKILDLRPGVRVLHDLGAVLHGNDVLALQRTVDAIWIDKTILDYIVALAHESRSHDAMLHGLSPRGSLSLAQVARASAVAAGRGYVTPSDVIDHFLAVASHRVVVRTTGVGTIPADTILRSILERTPSPM